MFRLFFSQLIYSHLDFMKQGTAGNPNNGFATIFTILTPSPTCASIIPFDLPPSQMGQIVQWRVRFQVYISTFTSTTTIWLPSTNNFVSEVRCASISSLASNYGQPNTVGKVSRLEFWKLFFISIDNILFQRCKKFGIFKTIVTQS